jgi:hypothetical protein
MRMHDPNPFGSAVIGSARGLARIAKAQVHPPASTWFRPAELLQADVVVCMLKCIERVTPMLKFNPPGVAVTLHGVRHDSPPNMVSIRNEIIVDMDEDDRWLELLHTNVRKFGTTSNAFAEATKLEATVRRRRE